MSATPASPPSGALTRLPDSPADWATAYRRHLLEFVAPFWPRHAIDREYGGLFSCIDDAGKVLSTEKYMWSQARAMWTFSALYGRMERKQVWLDMARSQYDFCRRLRPGCETGRWNFPVSRVGVPIGGSWVSLATNHFGIMGLVDYAKAIDSQELAGPWRARPSKGPTP